MVAGAGDSGLLLLQLSFQDRPGPDCHGLIEAFAVITDGGVIFRGEGDLQEAAG